MNIIMKWKTQCGHMNVILLRYSMNNMFANIAEDLHRPVMETCPGVVVSCVGVWHEKNNNNAAMALHLVFVCLFGSGHVMHRNYMRSCRGTQRRRGLHGGSAHFQNVKEVAIDKKNELNLSADAAQRCWLMRSQQETLRSFLFALMLSKH